MHIGNDAELGALAEHTRGAGRHMNHLIYLSCDVGVGGGVIVAGAPMMGASGYAGEIGHQTVQPAGADLPLRQRRLLGDRDRLARRGRGGRLPDTEMHRLAEYLQPGHDAAGAAPRRSGAPSAWASAGW